MPACPLPVARAAASCDGLVGFRRTRARRAVPRAAAHYCPFFPGWRAALGSRGLLDAPARSFTALAPAPRARARCPAPLRSLPRPRH
jgi:hypothetical protein